MAREGERVRVVEDQGARQRESGEVGEALAQFDGGQRVEPGVTERLLDRHPLGGGVAEHHGGLGPHEVDEQPLLFLLGEAAEALRQPGDGAGAPGSTEGRDGVDGVEEAAGPGGGEDRVVLLPVDVGDGHGGLAAYDGPAQLRHGGGGVQQPQAGAFQVLGDGAVGAGHADLGPGAPGDGGGGEAARAAVLGERVEVGVGGGVGALARAPPHPGDGGDQDEEVEVVAVEEGVEVGGAEGLGGHGGGDLVERGVGERRGLADAGGVHDAGEGGVLGHGGEHGGEGVAVGAVAGGEGDAGAQFLQFGAEFGGAGGVGAAAAGEDEVGGAGAGEPARGLGAEAAGAAGDQDGAGGRELVLAGQGVAGVPDDAAGQGAARADGELVLAVAGGEEADQPLGGRGVEDLRQVDQSAPLLGAFQGGDPAQAPGGGAGGVGERVAGAGGDGAAGDRPQRGGDGGVAEGLGEDHAEGEAGLESAGRCVGAGGLGAGGVGERQQRQDAADTGGAFGRGVLDGVAQGGGEEVAVEVGGVEHQALDDGAVAAQGGEDGVGRAVVLGGDGQPGPVEHRGALGTGGLPGDPVAGRVEDGAFLTGAAPGAQRRQQRVEGGVLLVAQAEESREPGGVAAFDGGPQLGVGRVAGAVAGASHGGRGGVRPVGLVLEGVRGQLDGAGAGRVDRAPVDADAAYVEPGEGGEDGFVLRPAGAQRRDGVGLAVVTEGVLGGGAQGAAGAQFEVGGGAGLVGGAHGVGEADGGAQVADPVVGGPQVVALGEAAREVTGHGDGGLVVRQALGDLAEGVQHGVHAGRVEGVADPQPAGGAAEAGEVRGDGRGGLLLAGDDDGRRPVDGGECDLVLLPLEQGQDLVLGRLERPHGAALGQGLHQAGAGGDQRAGVVQGEDAGGVGGADAADGVAEEHTGAHAPGPHQPVQRGLQGEQGGLGPAGLVEGGGARGALLGEHDVLEGAVRGAGGGVDEERVEARDDLVQSLGEDRVALVQFAAGAGALAALAGEEQGGAAGATGLAEDERRVKAVGGEGGQGAAGVVGGADDHGALLEGRTGGGQREGDIGGGLAGARVEVGEQPGGLGAQRGPGAAGEGPGQDGGFGGRGAGGPGGGGLALFQDDVGVGAADTEGGDTGAAGAAGLGPRLRLLEDADVAGLPVDVAGGAAGVQGAGQFAVAHRHDHLDDARHTGGGLGVADVGLHRAEQQRPVPGPVLAVCGEEGLGLDGVAEGGAGAVCLDRVDVGGGEAGRVQGLADDALLGGAVGGGQAVGGTVLVDGGPPDHGEDAVAVAARVGEPFQDEHADALGPADPVGLVGERLAAAVGRQAALAGELDERGRRGHHRDAAGQGERALARAQGLHRPVHGDQGGGAGGVDGDRRALQAQGVGDAAGGDAGGGPAALVALETLVGEGRRVVAVHDAGEDTGTAAAQADRVDTGVLDGGPGRLQQQSLLGVGGERLTGAHTEEARVELARVVQESAVAGVRGAGVVRVRVVEGVEVPASVDGQAADRVGALSDQAPQVVGRADAAGVAAAHADDDDRVVGGGGRPRGGGGGLCLGGVGQFGEEVAGQGRDGRVVEDDGGGGAQAGGGGQPVPQLDGGQGVEPELLEGAFGVDVGGGGVAEDGGRPVAHQVDDGLRTGLFVEPGEPLGEAEGGLGTGAHRAAGAGADQAAQERGHLAPSTQGGQVEADGQDGGAGQGEGGVEQGQALFDGERRRSGAGHALQVPLGEFAGHAAVDGHPGAPAEGEAGQPGVAAQAGDGIQEGVAGRVVGLAGGAGGAGEGGEHHEGGEVEVAGGPVQMPDGVGLGPQDGGEPLLGEGFDQSVVEGAGGVHDGGDGVGGRYGGEQPVHGFRVGHVAGGQGDLGAQRAEIGGESGGTGGVGAAPAGQHQVAYAALGDEVAGEGGAEAAGAAGDDNGPLGVPGGGGGLAVGADAGEPGGEHGVAPLRGLRFPGGEGRDERGGVGPGDGVEVEQAEAVGVFGLGGADQAPDGGGGRVGERPFADGDGAPGDEHQARTGPGVLGEPTLDVPEDAGGARVDLGGYGLGVAAADGDEHQGRRVGSGGLGERADGDPGGGEGGAEPEGVGAEQSDGAGGFGGVGAVEAGPVEVEEGVALQHAGGGPARVGGGAQHEGADRGDGCPGGVRDGEGDSVVARGGDADPGLGGAGRVEGDVLPGERQAAAGVLAERGEGGGVQGRVQQRRVQAERRGVARGPRVESHLDEGLLAPAPDGAQAAEGGAVGEAGLGQPLVEAVEGDTLGTGGRPDRGVELLAVVGA